MSDKDLAFDLANLLYTFHGGVQAPLLLKRLKDLGWKPVDVMSYWQVQNQRAAGSDDELILLNNTGPLPSTDEEPPR